jgi:hypothetical protein
LNGQQWASLPPATNQFTSFDASFNYLTPTSVPISGGVVVTITGRGFFAASSNLIPVRLLNRVLHQKPFDESKVVTAVRMSDSSMELVVPSWIEQRTIQVEVSLNGQQWQLNHQVLEYFRAGNLPLVAGSDAPQRKW